MAQRHSTDHHVADAWSSMPAPCSTNLAAVMGEPFADASALPNLSGRRSCTLSASPWPCRVTAATSSLPAIAATPSIDARSSKALLPEALRTADARPRGTLVAEARLGTTAASREGHAGGAGNRHRATATSAA